MAAPPVGARPPRVPRRVARAAGDLVRRRRGRRHRAARPQRRRQDDDAAGADGARRPPRPDRARRARTITSTATYKIVRRGVGYVPEDRDVFCRLSRSTRTCGSPSATAEPRYDLVYELFPELKERGAAARRDALGRPAADGRDRPGAPEREPCAARSTSPPRDCRRCSSPRSRTCSRASSELTTVLLVEQNLGVVRRVARDAIVLDTGRVVHIGPADELLDDKPMVHRLLGVGAAE